MGLDVELYYCDNWARYLSDRKQVYEFAKSLDWQKLNPEWFASIGQTMLEEEGQDVFNLHCLLDYPENQKIFDGLLIQFARQNRILMAIDRIGGVNCLEVAEREFPVVDKCGNNPLRFRMSYTPQNLDRMLMRYLSTRVATILGIPEDYELRDDPLYQNIVWEDALPKLESVIRLVENIKLDEPFDGRRELYLGQLSDLRNILSYAVELPEEARSLYRLMYSD